MGIHGSHDLRARALVAVLLLVTGCGGGVASVVPPVAPESTSPPSHAPTPAPTLIPAGSPSETAAPTDTPDVILKGTAGEAYLAAGAAFSSAVKAIVEKYPDMTFTPDDPRDYYTDLVAVYAEFGRAMGAITFPTDARAIVTEYLVELGKAQSAYASAALASTQAQLDEAWEQGNEHDARASALARELRDVLGLPPPGSG